MHAGMIFQSKKPWFAHRATAASTHSVQQGRPLIIQSFNSNTISVQVANTTNSAYPGRVAMAGLMPVKSGMTTINFPLPFCGFIDKVYVTGTVARYDWLLPWKGGVARAVPWITGFQPDGQAFAMACEVKSDSYPGYVKAFTFGGAR